MVIQVKSTTKCQIKLLSRSKSLGLHKSHNIHRWYTPITFQSFQTVWKWNLMYHERYTNMEIIQLKTKSQNKMNTKPTHRQQSLQWMAERWQMQRPQKTHWLDAKHINSKHFLRSKRATNWSKNKSKCICSVSSTCWRSVNCSYVQLLVKQQD